MIGEWEASRSTNASKSKGGVGTPLSKRDSVTNTVLPRFFSSTSVTSSVTCRDKMGYP